MNSDLALLIKLQDVDLAADRARRRIADMPLAQQALDSRLAEARTAVGGVKDRVTASQARRRDIEKDLAALQARLSKFKGQLMEVKTNKEYQAMQKEMGVAEHEIRAQEDLLLEQMEEAEALAAESKQAEAVLKAEEAAVRREQGALEAEAKTLEQEFTRLTAARAELVAHISAPALTIFQRVAYGRKGLAVAEARDGLCTVCHVRLRPQVFNDVRRNDGLHQCESCTRILYFVTTPAQDAP